MDDRPESPREPEAPSHRPPEPGSGEAGGAGPGSTEPTEDDWSREPAAAPGERSAAGSTVTASFDAQFSYAEHLSIAGQVFNQQFSFPPGMGVAEPVPLAKRHFRLRTTQELDLCRAELVFETQETAELEALFSEERFLVLAGEPEGGKGSLGLLLGAHLTDTFEWQGMLACRGLSQSVQVDLEKLASDGELAQHVVMFEDVLAGENSDLKTFLKTLDTLRLATLKERLHKNSAAILLTATSSSLTGFASRLESLNVLRTLSLPEPDLLVRACYCFAARLPRYGERKEAVGSFLAAHALEIARELKTIPRVARFVQEYLAEAADGNLTLRQALGRMDDLSQWLTIDLARDLEAQAAVLAIALGSATPAAEGMGMPWFAFDDLRRRILERLREELRIPDDQPSSPAGLGRDFLDRARAYVADMPSPLSDLVRFRDERYPQRLWQALIGPARDLATLLIPLLKQLAVKSTPVLREIAAAALGRLGQIGPADLAVPLLRQWTRQPVAREDLPGFFLQGSIGSNDETYKDFCLSTLRDLALGDEIGAAEAAVRNLGQLGIPEPEVPIRELCRIAQERLTVQMDELRDLEKEIAAREEQIRRQPRSTSSTRQMLHEQSLDLMTATLVPKEQIRLLGAIQYGLAGVLLSQTGDPGPVLRKLSARMKADATQLAPVLAYLFLHRRGLIDLLDRYKWRTAAFSQETSRFLLSARPGESDPKALAELLDRIFLTLDAFPGFFRFLLEERFLAILKAWCREGCEIDGLRPVVAELLSALLAAKRGTLRRSLERFLETDADFRMSGTRLRALARDVLHGNLTTETAPPAAVHPRRLPAWIGRRAGEET
jgi:hypothetical protein